MSLTEIGDPICARPNADTDDIEVTDDPVLNGVGRTGLGGEAGCGIAEPGRRGGGGCELAAQTSFILGDTTIGETPQS
jgi:hypothetical protein